MTLLHAIIMGLVQGLTEFLPVSSSAHLVFTDHLLHLHLSEQDTVSFDVLLHLGTLLAVLVYFRSDILALLKGAGRLLIGPRKALAENAYSRLFLLLLLGTVPAAIAGVALKDFFSDVFQNVPGTAALLLVTAAMLYWISRRRTGERALETSTWKDALTIGVFQAIAILPGVSRSGSTIFGGLLRGLDRDAAPRFSFLLSIPIILGGGVFALKDVLEQGFSLAPPLVIAGFLAAAVSGYIAVVLLLNTVRRGRLDRFAHYCVIVGLGMLAYWFLLVPKVDMNSVAGYSNLQPLALNADGEVNPVKLGERVSLRLAIQPGLIPLQRVYAKVPITEQNIEEADFIRATGSNRFESISFRLRPLGDSYTVPPGGEYRDVWIVVRNRWGISNDVHLRLRIEPATVQDRTV
ncbi:MAG: undecaprenyl-diphosphatase UppP [Armatimonadota bacterium]